MPKNSVKPYSETATSDPRCGNHITAYTEKTSLGGPIFKVGYGVMPCRVQLSGKILAAAGLKPRDQVEVTADSGVILIKKIGEPSGALPINGCSAAKKQMLDALMADTRAFEAEQKAAREQRYAYQEETEGEDEPESGPEPLDEVQRSREEL